MEAGSCLMFYLTARDSCCGSLKVFLFLLRFDPRVRQELASFGVPTSL